MQACGASNLKKVTLELGGKSPLVIFDDCDMERAVKNALQSVFFNKGKSSINRLLAKHRLKQTFSSFLIRFFHLTEQAKIALLPAEFSFRRTFMTSS